MVGEKVTPDMATRPHAVIFPFPAKGHSIPVLHFARQLSALGVTITFVNAFDHIEPKDFKAVEGLDKIRVVGLGGLPQPGDELGPLPMIPASERITKDFEHLLEHLNSTPDLAPPVCILCDMFLGWTQDVADKLNIAKYVLYTSPSSTLALMAYVPTLQKQGRLPVATEPFHDIPGVQPTVATDMPTMMLNYKEIPDVYDFFLCNCDRLPDAAGILINTFEELEHKIIEGVRKRIYGKSSAKGERSVLPIGPLLPPAYFNPETPNTQQMDPEERIECLKWLDSQPKVSVLFISFGSVSSLRAAQITALAKGLEESGQKFLYVCRPPSKVDGRDPIDGELKPFKYLPEGFEERIKGRGFLVPGWAPQLEVLSHPAIGGFLTHCGWNSMLESLCKGVPLLAWPLQAEQRMNGRFIVDEAGAALEFKKGSHGIVEADEVAKVVKQLFEGQEGKVVRGHVAKWRELAMKAVSPGGSSTQNLKKFVDEITSFCNGAGS